MHYFICGACRRLPFSLFFSLTISIQHSSRALTLPAWPLVVASSVDESVQSTQGPPFSAFLLLVPFPFRRFLSTQIFTGYRESQTSGCSGSEISNDRGAQTVFRGLHLTAMAVKWGLDGRYLMFLWGRCFFFRCLSWSGCSSIRRAWDRMTDSSKTFGNGGDVFEYS